MRLRGECERGAGASGGPTARLRLLSSSCPELHFLLCLPRHGSTESSNPHLSPPSYGLSCEIEPLSESASNTLKAKKNTGIIKRWSE